MATESGSKRPATKGASASPKTVKTGKATKAAKDAPAAEGGPAAGSARTPVPGGELEALSDAIESGAGLPSIARAAAAALGASVALIDRSSAVLAVAAGSPAEEEKLLGVSAGTEVSALRVADAVVGELRFMTRGKAIVDPARLRMVATLLGLELERARSPEWASDEAAHDFVSAVLERKLTDPADIAAWAAELGTELGSGAGVVHLRAHPNAAQTGDWRARVLMLTLRAVRAGGTGAVAYSSQGAGGEAAAVAAIVPGDGIEQIERAATEVKTELASSLAGFDVTIGYSRHAAGPGDLYRAGKEALLAVNVGEAEGRSPLAFEATGSYRLLLSGISEDPAELERFYEETIAPLADYDDHYETELVTTVEAYLDNDGNVTPTADSLFTHRHTIRYRLERVRELCGHDLTSTEGREKLGLGLKAMRVLGISAPRGPALEAGAKPGNSKGGKAKE